MSTFMTGSYTSCIMKYWTSAFLLRLSSTPATTVSMARTASLRRVTGRSWLAAHVAHREMRSWKNPSHVSCPPAQVLMTPRLRSGNGALEIWRRTTQRSSSARLRRSSAPSPMRSTHSRHSVEMLSRRACSVSVDDDATSSVTARALHPSKKNSSQNSRERRRRPDSEPSKMPSMMDTNFSFGGGAFVRLTRDRNDPSAVIVERLDAPAPVRSASRGVNFDKL